MIPAQYSYVAAAAVGTSSSQAYLAAQRGIANLTAALRGTLARNRLDALVYPEQKNLVVKIGAPSQSGRNGILAALTGSPVVTVPAGFSDPTEDAPIGVPIGMEILGPPWSEPRLLNMAQHLADLYPVRRMPVLSNGNVEVKSYDVVPTITPNRSNIPAAYPVGKL